MKTHYLNYTFCRRIGNYTLKTKVPLCSEFDNNDPVVPDWTNVTCEHCRRAAAENSGMVDSIAQQPQPKSTAVQLELGL